MKVGRKLALFLGSYLLALVIAIATVVLYFQVTSGPDRDASSGMHAFGDSVSFLGIPGAVSLPATCAALFFVRAYRPLWMVLSAVAVGLAATGILDLLALLTFPVATPDSWPQFFSLLSPLRILAAPVFAMAFVLAGLLAPVRWSQITVVVTAASEGGIFGLATCTSWDTAK